MICELVVRGDAGDGAVPRGSQVLNHAGNVAFGERGADLNRADVIGDRRAVADARVDARIALATRAIAKFGAVEADGDLGRQVGDVVIDLTPVA